MGRLKMGITLSAIALLSLLVGHTCNGAPFPIHQDPQPWMDFLMMGDDPTSPGMLAPEPDFELVPQGVIQQPIEEHSPPPHQLMLIGVPAEQPGPEYATNDDGFMESAMGHGVLWPPAVQEDMEESHPWMFPRHESMHSLPELLLNLVGPQHPPAYHDEDRSDDGSTEEIVVIRRKKRSQQDQQEMFNGGLISMINSLLAGLGNTGYPAIAEPYNLGQTRIYRSPLPVPPFVPPMITPPYGPPLCSPFGGTGGNTWSTCSPFGVNAWYF